MALATIGVVLPAGALADGDPASDVLVGQPLFLAQDAGAGAAQAQRLGLALAELARTSFPLRVAVIAARSDLGSVTALWRRPESYASFLGQELSLAFRGPLLVVMPNGFGLYGPGSASSRAALSGLPVGSASPAALAQRAVDRLAAARGVALTTGGAGVRSPSGAKPVLPWVVFGAGLALIAAAWTLSLRARPLGRPSAEAP